MQVPLSWLREYVDIDIPAQELAHRLTMAGVEVGEVIELGGWKECFVGEVLDVRPHPDADSLRLCRVTTGPEQMEVVCGAPNVAAGQKICFAKVGATLYNTHSGKQETLKAARIRGVVSEGMICSELELGLGEGHEGIVVLPEDAPLGTPLDQYLGDTVLDLEVTPNRLDCFSVLGVAHEVAAITGKTVREPEISYAEEGPEITSQATVSVADPDLCPRYTASLIQGLKIGPSPQWLQDRLTRAGLRPINNVVDVTNFVMYEFNQPLHAFDLDKVRDKTIIVRRAREGETLETLDGVERKLNTEVLVIADARDPVGLGGVIGGANSEIGPDTASVLLESANFKATNNRKTAENFRLRTEATQRFEKGL
ncbi:MAG: phenylalanine--tRNA ligase subunit beta, partial [Dehalococcoidia bacterium]